MLQALVLVALELVLVLVLVLVPVLVLVLVPVVGRLQVRCLFYSHSRVFNRSCFCLRLAATFPFR